MALKGFGDPFRVGPHGFPYIPKGSYIALLRTVVPETLPGMEFGTRVLKWAVYRLSC